MISENSTGTLRGSSNRSVSLRARCDVNFAKIILKQSEKTGLPVVGANYGTAAGSSSDMQMDWGTLVPLWFVLNEQRLKSRILIVAPSREIPLRMNFVFGRLLGRLMKRDRKRKFAFIASADQAHAHSRSGPYGFSPAAAKYDGFVLNAIRDNNLRRILSLKPRFVEEAKPDSLWQMVMLHGLSQGRSQTRASQDIDMLADLLTAPDGLIRCVNVVQGLDLTPEPDSSGRVYRFRRPSDRLVVDVLAPDHSPPRWSLRTARGASACWRAEPGRTRSES